MQAEVSRSAYRHYRCLTQTVLSSSSQAG